MARPESGNTTRLRFTKMHGAGNDFVVLDLRTNATLAARFANGDTALFRALADRRTGIGCDSIMTVEPPRTRAAVAAYGIRNADGSVSRQCGNGARCIAAWLVREGSAGGDRFALDSPAGLHAIEALGEGHYRIAMGVPQFDPQHVPLRGFARAQDVYTLEIGGRPVRFGAVSFGNPHALIEVDDVAQAQVESLGKRLQADSAFPEGVNAGFAQVLARDHIRLRVYERGAGETQACGSGACAAAVLLMRRGRVAREVTVSLPGGDLRVSWPHDAAPVLLSGPTTFVFDGEFVMKEDGPGEHARVTAMQEKETQ